MRLSESDGRFCSEGEGAAEEGSPGNGRPYYIPGEAQSLFHGRDRQPEEGVENLLFAAAEMLSALEKGVKSI